MRTPKLPAPPAGSFPAFPALALLSVLPAFCANQTLVSGAYGGTLGAGGATGAERCAFGQNPAAFRPGRAGAQLDFHRPFGLDGLEVAEAGAYWDGNRWGVSAGWRQTGVAGLYAEHGFQLTQTLRLGRTGAFPGVLDLGAAWNGWLRQWPGGTAEMAWDHGLGLAWRPVPRLKAGAFLLGLPLHGAGPGTEGAGGAAPWSRGAGTGRSWYGQVLQWGIEADSRDPAQPGQQGQVLRLDFRKTGEASWRTLAALSVGFRPGMEFTGGFAGPPFQASLGARFCLAGWDLRQALRYHRFLGRTWLSGLAYSRPREAVPHN